MNDLPNNFGKADFCEFSCNNLMNDEHLLNCVHLNERKFNNLTLEQLRNGNIAEKVKVFNKLQHNSNQRNIHRKKQTI